MRSGRLVSAKQVHMTWTDDATMNEDKPCLQRDVTEVDVSKRGAGRTCLMFVVIPRCTMSTEQLVERGNVCQGKPACRYTVTFVTTVCYAEVSSQVFLLNTLHAETETINALVVVWVGGQSTLRITGRDFAQTERTH